nr:hypothetical protein B0A51_04508 [Rachicladosporium sp. CCFEE 5018]
MEYMQQAVNNGFAQDPFLLQTTKQMEREMMKHYDLLPRHQRLPKAWDYNRPRLPGIGRRAKLEREQGQLKTKKFYYALAGGLSLIVPMLIMRLVPGVTCSLVTTSVAVLLFAIIVARRSSLQPQEILGIVAAYAAVLVVFVVTLRTIFSRTLVADLTDTTNNSLPSASRQVPTTVSESVGSAIASVVDDTEHAETPAVEDTEPASNSPTRASASLVGDLQYEETQPVTATTDFTRPLTPDNAVEEDPEASPCPVPNLTTPHGHGNPQLSPPQAAEQSPRADSLSPSRSSLVEKSKVATVDTTLDATLANTSESTPRSPRENEGSSRNAALEDPNAADSAAVWDEASSDASRPAPTSLTDGHGPTKNAAVNAFRVAINATVTYGTFVDTSTLAPASPRFSESTPETTYCDDSEADGGATLLDEACDNSAQTDDTATHSDTAGVDTKSAVPAPIAASENAPDVTTSAPSTSPHLPTAAGLTKGRLPTLDAMVASGYLKVVAGSSTDSGIREPLEKPEKKEFQEPPREEPLAFDDRPQYLWADIAYFDKRHQVPSKQLPEAPVAAATRWECAMKRVLRRRLAIFQGI